MDYLTALKTPDLSPKTFSNIYANLIRFSAPNSSLEGATKLKFVPFCSMAISYCTHDSQLEGATELQKSENHAGVYLKATPHWKVLQSFRNQKTMRGYISKQLPPPPPPLCETLMPAYLDVGCV